MKKFLFTALCAFAVSAFAGEVVPSIQYPPQIHNKQAGIGSAATGTVEYNADYVKAGYKYSKLDTTLLLSDALDLQSRYLHTAPNDPIVAVLTQNLTSGPKLFSFPLYTTTIPGAKYIIEKGDGRDTSVWQVAAPGVDYKYIYTSQTADGTFFYVQSQVPISTAVGNTSFLRVRASDGK